MKKILSTLVFLCLFILCFNYSCKKDNVYPDKVQEGKVEFSIRVSEELLNGSLKSAEGEKSDIHSVIVSITDMDGQSSYEKEELLLLNMNGYYISKPISLPVGDYKLTEFIILDAGNNVLYITPRENSPKAYLVEHPLPVNFSIEKDSVTKLVPEVIRADSGTPEDYGYSTFSFSVVVTFDFLLGVFAYDHNEENFTLTEAELKVSHDGNQLFCGDLDAVTNTISLRDASEKYTLEISKQGYLPYTHTYSADTLKSYTSEDAGPLIIVLEKRSPSIKKGSIILWWTGYEEKFGTLDIEAKQIFTLGKVGELSWWSVSGPCAVINDKLYAAGMNTGSSNNKKLYTCDIRTGEFLNEQSIEDNNYSFAGIYKNQIVTVWWQDGSEKFGLLNPSSGEVSILGEVGNMKFWQASSPCAVINDKLVVFGVEDDKLFRYPHKGYVCDLESGKFIKKLSLSLENITVAGSYKQKLVIAWKVGYSYRFGLLDIETGCMEELGLLENLKYWDASRPCTIIEDKLVVIGAEGPTYKGNPQQVYIYSLESGKYIESFKWGGKNCSFAW